MSTVPMLRNIWWVAMWSQDLEPGRLLARRIMNEPLVFYRTQEGRPTALLDRCAHRWAPLSKGKVVDGDRLQCPYHGLEYDAHGLCVHNPHPNYQIPSAMRVRSYPLAEKHSLIWIWMGDAPPDESLIPDFSLLDPGGAEPIARDWLRMDASWDLLTDNLLDTSHVAFLHTSSFGSPNMADAVTVIEQPGKTQLLLKRDFTDMPVPKFWDLLLFKQYPRIDFIARTHWFAPACFINLGGAMPVGGTMADGTGTTATHFLTPETDETCHYHFSGARWNPILRSPEENADAMRQIADIRKQVFVDEDGVIIAAQQRRIREAGKASLTPVLIGADAGIERAHRILRRLSDDERLVASG